MKNIIKTVVKYLFVSVFTSAVYGLLNYFTGKEVQIKNLITFSIILFICFCIFAFVVPLLRKALGFNDKK